MPQVNDHEIGNHAVQMRSMSKGVRKGECGENLRYHTNVRYILLRLFMFDILQCVLLYFRVRRIIQIVLN